MRKKSRWRIMMGWKRRKRRNSKPKASVGGEVDDRREGGGVRGTFEKGGRGKIVTRKWGR